MLDNKEFASLIDVEKDILNHPLEKIEESSYLKSIFKDENIFTLAEIEELNKAFKIILADEKLTDEKRVDYLNNLWKINYNQKPPSPEEFLTEEWIGATAEALYPHVKKGFLDFFNPTSKYRNLCEYWPLGAGKSVLVSLCKGYIATLDYFLRDYKRFFKLSPTTYVVDGTVSLSLDMAFDLNIRPLLNILGTSKKFCKVQKENQLLRKMKEDPSTIYYTTAVKGNAILRIGDLHYHVISDSTQLLGLTLQLVSLTELAFLQEKGMKPEEAMRLLNDSKSRVYSRFGNHYLARTIIDSSPNDLNNPVDRYIYYEAHKDPTVLFLMDTKWNLQKFLFPIYEKTNETFPVYLGDASKSPKIIVNEEDKINYDPTEIMDFPIDIKQLAIDGLSKVIKDFGGRPSGGDSKLITNYDIIEDMFIPTLKNFPYYEHAPVSLPPEGLLWEIVKKQFFIYSGRGNLYEFYRCPRAERFISIDLAESHDMASISMTHLEKNMKNEKMYINDFTLIIFKTKENINLDSFKFLILDMVKYGGITVKIVSFDRFESGTSRQALERHGIEVIRFSVDLSPEPYLSFISYMQTRRVKLGRNLIIKNNLKSLINYKRPKTGTLKIEHVKGEWVDMQNYDWDLSKMGYNGKDGSDSLVASIALADSYGSDSADFIFDEVKEANKTTEQGKKDILIELQSKYNLVIKK